VKIFEDGTLFVMAGEPFPMKCPNCGTYIPYSDDVAIVCGSCGHRDAQEEFCDAMYEMATKQ